MICSIPPCVCVSVFSAASTLGASEHGNSCDAALDLDP
jgi:hypothetical protein